MSVRDIFHMECPHCQSDRLRIQMEIWVDLQPDGDLLPSQEKDGDWEWAQHSPCLCLSCGHTGEVDLFIIDPEEEA